MSRASVLALITDYAFNLDDVTVDGFYDDMMWDAARWGVATSIQLIPSARGDAEYVLPDTEGRTYALFYDDVMLSPSLLQQLEAVNPLWRQASGKPNTYVVQDQSDRRFRVYPAPDANSEDFVFLFGAPMGHDFPERAIGCVIGEQRADQPSWLDIPLALAILGREFERESDHRDTAFAAACRDTGNQLLALVLA